MLRSSIEFNKETKKFIAKVAKSNRISLSKQCSIYLDERVAQEKKKKTKEPEIISSLNKQ